jgi:SAM-dependent methyltransferase
VAQDPSASQNKSQVDDMPQADNQDFYEGAGMRFMQADLFTPPIYDYLVAEGDFWRKSLYGLGRVMEVGCGAGNNLVALAPHIDRLIGVDYAEQMVNHAQQRTQDFDHVKVLRGYAERLDDYVSETLDAVFFAWNTFGNMTQPQHQEIMQALKQITHGVVYLSVYRTGKPVMDARLAYYDHIGMAVQAIDGDHVTLLADGATMTAYAYANEYYEALAHEAGFDITFDTISTVGQIVALRPSSNS